MHWATNTQPPKQFNNAQGQAKFHEWRELYSIWGTHLNSSIFDLGVNYGWNAWCAAQTADAVYVWDQYEKFKAEVDAFNLPNIHWSSPQSTPPVETALCQQVLQWRVEHGDGPAWIDQQCDMVDAEWWVFREGLDPWQDTQWPHSLHSPGFQLTVPWVEECSSLSIHSIHEATLPDARQESGWHSHRWVICRT